MSGRVKSDALTLCEPLPVTPINGHRQAVRLVSVPCVDGSGLARTFFTFCSIGRCSHVFGLLTRFT